MKNEQEVNSIRKAAEQGDAETQFNFGVMCHKGEDMTKDVREAAHWYLAAAKQGFIEAQYSIGAMYYAGEGIVQDEHEAYIWFLIAKAGDNKAAEQALQENTWQWSKFYGSESLAKENARSEAAKRMTEIEKQRRQSTIS